MSAQVIKFTPAPPEAPIATPINQGYTKLDNGTDLLVLAELPNALVKPYLFLLSRRGLRLKAVHWGEVAAFCKRGQSQTFTALNDLKARGLVTCEAGMYQAIPGFTPETRRKVEQKPGMSDQKNVVLDSVEEAPELRNEGTKENNNIFTGMDSLGTDPQTADERGEIPEATQVPDGMTADAAPVTSPSQDVLKTAQGERGDETVKGFEKGSAVAAPSPYTTAMSAILAVDLKPAWVQWVRLNKLQSVTQEAQAPVWQAWIEAGHAKELAHEVAHIVQSGSYSFPWSALQKRMEAYKLGNPAAQQGQQGASLAEFRPGVRFRFPDGSEALVVSVQARGISTDHAQFRDVPLGQLKTLEVIK